MQIIFLRSNFSDLLLQVNNAGVGGTEISPQDLITAMEEVNPIEISITACLKAIRIVQLYCSMLLIEIWRKILNDHQQLEINFKPFCKNSM